MVGLVDIAPAVETVGIRGHEIEVTGVSAAGVATLLSRFPELRRLFAGRDVSMDQLVAVGGDLVNAIIAAGTGRPGDEAAERAAGRLSVEEQADLLGAILRATLPRGVGPFMETLAALGAALGADVPAAAGAAPATRSRKPSKN